MRRLEKGTYQEEEQHFAGHGYVVLKGRGFIQSLSGALLHNQSEICQIKDRSEKFLTQVRWFLAASREKTKNKMEKILIITIK